MMRTSFFMAPQLLLRRDIMSGPRASSSLLKSLVCFAFLNSPSDVSNTFISFLSYDGLDHENITKVGAADLHDRCITDTEGTLFPMICKSKISPSAPLPCYNAMTTLTCLINYTTVLSWVDYSPD